MLKTKFVAQEYDEDRFAELAEADHQKRKDRCSFVRSNTYQLSVPEQRC